LKLLENDPVEVFQEIIDKPIEILESKAYYEAYRSVFE